MNGLLYERGQTADFDHWAKLGNPSWGWSDVLPYFKKTENNTTPPFVDVDAGKYHSTSGEMKVDMFLNSEPMKGIFIEAAQELGYGYVDDVNAEEKLGYTQLQGTIYGGSRQTTAKALLAPVMKRGNLDVIKHAVVTKLEINKSGIVTGVQFLYNGTNELTAKVRKEVVLSAGAVNTPQILMLSGIGPEKHLRKMDIPVVKALPVGLNLQDHLVTQMFFQFHQTDAEEMSKEELLDSLYMYAIHQMGSLAATGSADLAGYINTVDHKSLADIRLHHVSFRKNSFELQFYLTMIGYDEMIGRSILDANRMGDIMVVYVVLRNPKSRGMIRLRSANPTDKPRIFANYLADRADEDTLLRAVKYQASYVDTKSFKGNEGRLLRLPLADCKSLEYMTDEYWRCYISYMSTTFYDPAGTAKMGPSTDSEAVVDSRLRVNGVHGLRVADASVMPTLVSANTNAATVMIGEKAADFIREDFKIDGHNKKEEL